MSKKLLLPKDLQQARLDEKWSQLKGIFDAWASKLTNVSGNLSFSFHLPIIHHRASPRYLYLLNI